MKKKYLALLSALCALCLSSGSAAYGQAQPANSIWGTDVKAALKQAEAEQKDVLVYFSGSDWDDWTQKINSEIFAQDHFKQEAPRHFILVQLDFPKKTKLSPEVSSQNANWMKQLNVQGFPTLMLLDAKGRPFAQEGYASGGAETYLEKLVSLQMRRVERDEKWLAASKAEGAEKIQLLESALNALQNDVLMFEFYDAQIKNLEKLDADDKLGVKERFVTRLKTAQAKKLFEDTMPRIIRRSQSEPQAALKEMVALAADKRINPEFKQKTLYIASQLCKNKLNDLAQSEKFFDESIAADPESRIGVTMQLNKAQIYQPQTK